MTKSYSSQDKRMTLEIPSKPDMALVRASRSMPALALEKCSMPALALEEVYPMPAFALVRVAQCLLWL